MRRAGVITLVSALLGSGCSSPASSTDAARVPHDARPEADAGEGIDAFAGIDAFTGADAFAPADPRDRLLATYLAFLEETPTVAQSNGLRGDALASVCDLWAALDPSSRATYLTLTARLAGSHLGSDGTAALDHVVRLYRVTGGQDATATDPGSCGGGEYNRMIVSIDAALHDALVAANDRGGAAPHDLADIPAESGWRDSHDLAGPHTPFDLRDETASAAPRGQVQFFRDPASAAATSALGRMDLATLVDPYALEIDHDYDCVHASNPLCTYITYGPACLPRASETGAQVYAETYGPVDLTWRPAGCP